MKVKASSHPAALHSVSTESTDVSATSLLCIGMADAL